MKIRIVFRRMSVATLWNEWESFKQLLVRRLTH